MSELYHNLFVQINLLQSSGLGGKILKVLLFNICFLFRSVASWFDENGVLVFEILERDIRELHASLVTEKKDK